MERHRTIAYKSRFDDPPERVWAVFSDTERLNQASATPWTPYVAEDVLQPDGSVQRHATGKVGPFSVRWREGFGQWVEKRHLRQERHFENGPFRELSVDIRLEPDGDGTLANFLFIARWSSVLGDLLAAVGVLPQITRPVVTTLEALVAEARTTGGVRAGIVDAAPSDAKRDRVASAVALIEERGFGHGLARRLADFLTSANPLDLRRLRPLALAADWQMASDRVIELFVAAHAAGLLAMRWEIMCPRCRGGKSQTDTLADLPAEVHCSSCNIDYGRDFENNVELVFSPEPWLRELPEGDYCMMGPATTPHVKVQCDVEPGQTRLEPVELPPGRYRVRTVEAGDEAELDYDGGPFPEVLVSADAVETGPSSPAGQVALRNLDARRRGIVVESAVWSTLALTGPRVIALQAFRELCPEQLLRPGDEVSIGRVAILFSDLKGSTALYEKIGDSRAYVLVREHFDFLTDRVRANGGAVVKTIGDAVMAAFPEGSAALSAAIEIQSGVAEFNRGRADAGIELKIGLHEGHCIAVTTGGVLDYFGSSVNLAARLQGESRGGDIVLSPAVHDDPSTEGLLAGRRAARETVTLSGFAEPMICYRVAVV